VVGTSLTNYIKNPTEDVSWLGFRRAFVDTLSELKSCRKFKDINSRNIFPRLRVAYMGIIWRDLSIDLVAASLRQREFAIKITGDECHALDSPAGLSTAITRYLKFLHLLKNKDPSVPQKNRHLVPTLDIDLC
jgi:Glycine-rich domain-containing protein-like